MNWITTNIRIPEDVYMDLKMIAAAERKSMAEVIRERLADKPTAKTDDMLAAMDVLGKELVKLHPGFDSTKAIREMRDEQ